jgi:hypothetical protein
MISPLWGVILGVVIHVIGYTPILLTLMVSFDILILTCHLHVCVAEKFNEECKKDMFDIHRLMQLHLRNSVRFRETAAVWSTKLIFLVGCGCINLGICWLSIIKGEGIGFELYLFFGSALLLCLIVGSLMWVGIANLSNIASVNLLYATPGVFDDITKLAQLNSMMSYLSNLSPYWSVGVDVTPNKGALIFSLVTSLAGAVLPQAPRLLGFC